MLYTQVFILLLFLESPPCPFTLTSAGVNDAGFNRNLAGVTYNQTNIKMNEFNLGRGLFIVEFDLCDCSVVVCLIKKNICLKMLYHYTCLKLRSFEHVNNTAFYNLSIEMEYQ